MVLGRLSAGASVSVCVGMGWASAMDAAHAAHSAEHGASTKTRNTNGATKVGAMAAAIGMMIIAIKIHTVDRRPVAQAGIIQGVS